MSILLSVFLGICGSVIASCIFLMVLREFRPDIEISPTISRWEKDETINYSIKILNKGKRKAINLKFELLIVKKESIPDGEMLSTNIIKLKKDHAFIIHEFDKKSKDAKFARRIGSLEPIDQLWDDDSSKFIVFRVYAHDEVSGLAKMFEKEYRTKRNSIIDGQFSFGNSFEIT